MPDRLLVVDDEIDFAKFAGQVGESAGYEARVTSNAKDFKEDFEHWHPSVVILDLSMPEVDGVELLRWLSEQHWHAQLIIMSGFDERVVEAAKMVGEERGLCISYALSKPVRMRELREKLESLKGRTALTPETKGIASPAGGNRAQST